MSPMYSWRLRGLKSTAELSLSILEEVGVEDISFHGSWLEDFEHHKNVRHDSGWSLVEFRGCVNSWARRLSFVNVNRALEVKDSAAISIYQVTLSGNGGHNSMMSLGNYGIWFGLVEDLADHYHGINVMFLTTGNVYWRADQSRDQHIDCHASRPYANLYDRINRGRLDGSGGGVKDLPNHYRHLVIWNFNHAARGEKYYNFWPSSGDFFVKPIVVGLHGDPASFRGSTLEVLESNGSAVEPESLFEAQLELRLGTLPSWLSTLQSE